MSAPLVAEAQEAGKAWRIGTLDMADSRGWAGFRDGLRNLGLEVGRSVNVEFRWSGSHVERYQEIAAELLRTNVDLLVTGNWESTKAAKQATSTIPIVMLGVPDPPAAGLVGRPDKPDSNVTGITYAPADLTAKSVELLRELRPGLGRAALLYEPHVWVSSVRRQRLSLLAARAGIQLLPLIVNNRDDLDTALAALMLERPDVVIVDLAGRPSDDARTVSEFAIKQGLPTLSESSVLVDAGVLMSFGPGLFEMGRRAANYVEQIIKGVQLADLPVEQHKEYELVVNIKTAKALGLTIPQSVLGRAHRVIE